MADITMCINESCYIKDTCYRYLAKPSKYLQSYADFKQNGNKNCDYYINYQSVK